MRRLSAHRGARGFAVSRGLAGGWLRWRLSLFAAVRDRTLFSACEPVGEHGGGGLHGNRGLLPLSTSVRFLNIPVLPATNTICWPSGEEEVVVEVVHARCAGLDMSRKDAKVCVRIAGAGRRRTLETVTTWSAMTNQVLALGEP